LVFFRHPKYDGYEPAFTKLIPCHYSLVTDWVGTRAVVSEELFNKRRTEFVIVSPACRSQGGKEEVSHCSGEITPYEWGGDGQSRLSNGRNAYPSTEQHLYLFQCKFALVGFKHYDDTSGFNVPVYDFPLD